MAVLLTFLMIPHAIAVLFRNAPSCKAMQLSRKIYSLPFFRCLNNQSRTGFS